jgi:hypothetical protein
MTKKSLNKIIELCENCLSDIDIDKAVSNNWEYQIGMWDLCQQIYELTAEEKKK